MYKKRGSVMNISNNQNSTSIGFSGGGENFTPTEEQLKVITAPLKSTIISAGAGTGKTTTILYTVQDKVIKKLVDPTKVILITFTNKAAENLYERSRKICPELLADNISTIHSFIAKRILSSVRGYNVLDELSYTDLIRSCLYGRELPIYNKSYTFVPQNALGFDEKSDGKIINNIKNYILFKYHLKEDYSAYKEYYCYHEWAELVEQQLLKSNSIPLSAFPSRAIEKLNKSPELLNELREEIDLIIVDEAQDLTSPMWALYSMFQKPVFCIGDPAQAIYGWAGANSKIFDSKLDDSAISQYTLTRNHRSPQKILDVANEAAHIHNIAHYTDLHTVKGQGATPKMIITRNTNIDLGSLVLNQLENWGVDKLKKTVLIARNNATLEVIQNYLENKGIDTLIKSAPAQNDIEQRVINLLHLHELYKQVRKGDKHNYGVYVKRLYNVYDGVYFWLATDLKEYENKRVILQNILENSQFNSPYHLNVSDSPVAVSLLKFLERDFEWGSISNKIAAAFELLFPKPDDSSRELMQWVSDDLNSWFNTHPDASIEELCMTKSLDSSTPLDETWCCNKLKMMTVHKAKGLESDNVIIVDAPSPMYSNKRAKLSEEWRVMHVAVTRAKENEIIICNENSMYLDVKDKCNVEYL